MMRGNGRKTLTKVGGGTLKIGSSRPFSLFSQQESLGYCSKLFHNKSLKIEKA